MMLLEHSLVAKVTTAAALIAATLIASGAVLLAFLETSQTRETVSWRARFASTMVVEGVTDATWDLDPKGVKAALSPLLSLEDFASATVYGPHGEVFVSLQRPGMNSLSTESNVVDTAIIRHDPAGDRNLGNLHVEFDMRSMAGALRLKIMVISGIGVLVLALVVVGTGYVMRGITAPLVRMTEAMSTLADGKVDIDVPSRHRKDEIGVMAAAMGRFKRDKIELRQAKDEAEKATLSKSRFLAAASHDLRQPVQALLMFIDVLRLDAVTPEQKDNVNSVEQIATVLKNQLDGLLDVSRLEAGKIVPNIDAVPLQEILQTLEAQFTHSAAKAGLSFAVEKSSASVQSDRVLLLRMLCNLVENAIRYTPQGAIEVVVRQDTASVVLEIRDTGIGIPQEHLEAIWDEFHQVGNSERNRHHGLGLGLAIVRRLSALLSHPVKVTSTPGLGSVFQIELPMAPAPEARPTGAGEALQPPSAPQPPNLGVAVLAVDDDPMILRGVCRFLARQGCVVAAAATGAEACALAAQPDGFPDVIIADYQLGNGETGLDVIHALRRQIGVEVPAIVLTGQTDKAVIDLITQHNVLLLHKPISPSGLGAAVRAALGG